MSKRRKPKRPSHCHESMTVDNIAAFSISFFEVRERFDMRKDATGNFGTTFCSPAVRERPILFSGEMVRAILDGRKTQTRRICKPQPDGFWCNATNTASHIYRHGYLPWWQLGGINHKCPYGQSGDRLWVRETWKTGCSLDQYSPKEIREKYEDAGYRLGDRANGKCCPMLYLANGEHNRWGDHDIADFGEWGKTRVSIHMPRWASRITLEIVDVRAESLQDISEHDAWMEGCHDGVIPTKYPTSVAWFHDLWTSINGPSSWTANPWVWVVEFRRVLGIIVILLLH